MEITKFWTKTKIILLVIILLIIIGIIGFIIVHRIKLKKEYIRLENKITNDAAPNYMQFEQISLKLGEYREIDIKLIKEDKLISSRADDCDGYVIVENIQDVYNYKTYLKCKNIYKTEGYGNKSALSKNNSKTQSQEDTEKPKITLLGSSTMTIGLNEKFKDPGAVAEDKIDGKLTSKIKVEGEVDTTKEGTYTLTYSVSDSSGNKATKKRTVIVSKDATKEAKDKNVPVITFTNEGAYQKICTGEKVNISKDGLYGYTATDDVDGDITDNVKVSGDVGTINTVGDYTVNYSVKDKAGNEATSSRKFSVIDCNKSQSTPTPDPTPTPAPTPAPTPTPSDDGGSSSSSSSGSNTPSVNPNVETAATGIDVPDTLYVGVGQTKSLNASVLPSNASNKSLSYKVINPNIATVDGSGNVRGVSKGETRITISTSNGKTAGVVIIVE